MLTFAHAPGTSGNTQAEAAYDATALEPGDMVSASGDTLVYGWELFAPSVGDLWHAPLVFDTVAASNERSRVRHGRGFSAPQPRR